VSLDDLTLFDATEYGEATPRRATRKGSPALPVEPLEDPWVYIRTKNGPAPYAHIVKSLGPEGLGTYLTICNLLGSKLTNVGVAQMIRCPECEVGRQLS
jgi:hypothetical protein